MLVAFVLCGGLRAWVRMTGRRQARSGRSGTLQPRCAARSHGRGRALPARLIHRDRRTNPPCAAREWGGRTDGVERRTDVSCDVWRERAREERAKHMRFERDFRRALDTVKGRADASGSA